ncbi:hypothetical protein RFM23_05475 [Mesorhizobium abyssinicae]|uniref:Phage tail assembly protein n=1 Tax=Mesorhizobium abyssinicae TaxID=1209958 RepID=A0ABU5AIG3_9HYPH|nr:hypothetical protein [Mesorhizobium abyssinicae]MDX8537073.1 hypothetical protein [Mesorhizobium abyssinicae]
MKIDFTQKLLTITGIPLKASADRDASDLTLQDVSTNALLTPAPAQQPGREVSFADSANAFKLALRISNAPEACDVKSEEITQIKQAIGRIYGPNVCGPVEMLLEGGAVVAEKAPA